MPTCSAQRLQRARALQATGTISETTAAAINESLDSEGAPLQVSEICMMLSWLTGLSVNSSVLSSELFCCF